MAWRNPRSHSPKRSIKKSPSKRTKWLELGHVGEGNNKIILYRAARDMDVDPPSCWAEHDSDAIVYLNNPGYGGPVLHEVVLHYDTNEVLDLTKKWDEQTFDELAESYFKWWKTDHYTNHGYRGPYALWEDNPGFAQLLMDNGYKYIVYEDDFPHGCMTWSMMENAPAFPSEPVDISYLKPEFDPRSNRS